MRLLLFSLFISSLILVYACKKFKAAPEAFFIQPGNIKINVTTKQGSSSHKITDLWVYVNGLFKGVYPFENKIPIVSSGKKVRIDVYAGIKNNGISNTRLNWLLYDKIEFDTLVENGATISRDFTFSYLSNTTFKFLENFDNQGQSFIRSSNSAASTVSLQLASSSESFDGKYLELKIMNGGDYAQIETYNYYEMPLANSNVYLELNYKCNNPFSVALIGDNGQLKDVFDFNTQTNWNKAYIQLAEVVNSAPATSNYKLCFFMAKTVSDEPRLLLDNLKIVYL